MRSKSGTHIALWLISYLAVMLYFIQPTYASNNEPDDIARALYQSTFGPTPALKKTVAQLGIEGWISKQIHLTPTYHRPLYNKPFSKGGQANRENAWYQIVLTSEDQLRQRMAFALSQILVVSRYHDVLSGKPSRLVNYYDLLIEHAFGNYRELLYRVAVHPAMGSYLSLMGSSKANSATGTLPDENFARELMQLFTLGLYQLNLDGSFKIDAVTGDPIPTYTQTDVQEMARALTGWNQTNNKSLMPMHAVNRLHDTGEKVILGKTIPQGLTAPKELKRVIDILMAHPNIAPFVSKRLIQRFVTSNPSPEYISRVAATFNNNGKGVKGDLSAVIKAILLDKEARQRNEKQPEKVKEPIIVVTNFHRATGFSVKKDVRFDKATTIMNIADQGPLRSPSVFNFYEANYQPSTAFMQAHLVSPEYQLLNWSVYTGLVQFMLNDIRSDSANTYALDLKNFYALLDDHQALVNLIDERFFAGTASTKLKALMLKILNGYQSDYVPETKLAMVIFTAISGEEFYLQY